MDAEKSPKFVYLVEPTTGEASAFLCPYRVFSKLMELYRVDPSKNLILKDFMEMEQAFEKGEAPEMIRGVCVRRLPIII